MLCYKCKKEFSPSKSALDNISAVTEKTGVIPICPDCFIAVKKITDTFHGKNKFSTYAEFLDFFVDWAGVIEQRIDDLEKRI